MPPSIIVSSGLVLSFLCARFIAKNVAFKILIRSISPCSTAAIEDSAQVLIISSYSLILSVSLSFFESVTPAIGLICFWKTTQAATTGPASGPLPASSIPAMARYLWRSRFS